MNLSIVIVIKSSIISSLSQIKSWTLPLCVSILTRNTSFIFIKIRHLSNLCFYGRLNIISEIRKALVTDLLYTQWNQINPVSPLHQWLTWDLKSLWESWVAQYMRIPKTSWLIHKSSISSRLSWSSYFKECSLCSDTCNHLDTTLIKLPSVYMDIIFRDLTIETSFQVMYLNRSLQKYYHVAASYWIITV